MIHGEARCDSWDGISDVGSAINRGARRKQKCLRSEMSIESKIFDRRFDGIPVTGVGCSSGKDARANAGSGWELGCGSGRDGDDGAAVEVVAGSKICKSGSPFPGRAREVSAGDSSRTEGSRQDCPGCRDDEDGRPSFRWG